MVRSFAFNLQTISDKVSGNLRTFKEHEGRGQERKTVC